MSKVPKHELEIVLRKLSDLEESVAEIKDKVRGLLEGSNVTHPTSMVTPPTTPNPKSPSPFNSSLNEKLTQVYGNKTFVSVGNNVKVPAPVQTGSSYGKKPSSGIVGERLSAFESSSDKKGNSPRAPPPPIPSATFRKFSVKTQKNDVGSDSVSSSPVNMSSPGTASINASAGIAIGSAEKPKLPHIPVDMKNEILKRTNSTANTSPSLDPQVPKQFQQKRVNDSDSEAEKNADDDDDWD